jgi:hypothetical protein
MGASYYAGVILGLKLSDIKELKVEHKSESYEIHDKRGNPTGKFDTETKTIVRFGDRMIVCDDSFGGIEKLINPQKPLIFIDQSYEGFQFETAFIGIELVKNGYDEWNMNKEFDPNDDRQMIKDEFLKQFGMDIEPRTYFYFNVYA